MLKYFCQNRVKQSPKAPGPSPQSSEVQKQPDPKMCGWAAPTGSWVAPTGQNPTQSSVFVSFWLVSWRTSNILTFLDPNFVVPRIYALYSSKMAQIR